MIKVTTADLQRDIEHYRDLALHQPVAVTLDGEDKLVLLSTEEYLRLRRRDRAVLAIDEFSEAEAEAIERMDPGTDAMKFDDEVAPRS